jgi:tRNA nucleotidyltransferase/poly(A) polymerase
MDERVRTAVAGVEAYVVGGAVRDELLGRPVVDVDVATHDPEMAARIYAGVAKGALFPLSERHGAWRVAFRDGRTVDFTPLRGDIEDDLRTRDFTINAIAQPAAGGERIDPLGGVPDLQARRLRAVSASVFEDDPLRLLRAVRLEDELGFALDEETERRVREQAGLVVQPAGERILGELERLSPGGFRRADELGLLGPLGGSLARLDDVDLVDSPGFLLVVVFGEALFRLPISNEQKRFAKTLLAASRPQDATPREIHRFRRATEPWALSALAFLGATELYAAVRAARAADPSDRLLTGEDILALGVEPGPEVGRLLELVEEERAAGTISTRDEALELVQREMWPHPTSGAT